LTHDHKATLGAIAFRLKELEGTIMDGEFKDAEKLAQIKLMCYDVQRVIKKMYNTLNEIGEANDIDGHDKSN
jgi:regulator of RNase E activity RraA